jgi:hypothetical protein
VLSCVLSRVIFVLILWGWHFLVFVLDQKTFKNPDIFTFSVCVIRHCHWLDSPLLGPGLLKKLCPFVSVEGNFLPFLFAMSSLAGRSGFYFLRFRDNVFYPGWLSALCPTRSDPGGPMFSVGVVTLSWPAPTKALGTRFSPLHVLAIRGFAQGPWNGHACMGLGRNKRHFLSFVGTQLSANHAPSGPHTTPLAPMCNMLYSKRTDRWEKISLCLLETAWYITWFSLFKATHH